MERLRYIGGMTLVQLESLVDDELAILFHVVNVIDPMPFPKMEFDMNSIKWMRRDILVKKLIDAFPRLKPEAHATYVSLMNKLGVNGEVRHQQPAPPTTASAAPAAPVEPNLTMPETIEAAESEDKPI